MNAGLRLSGGEVGCDILDVSAAKGVWLLGGFLAESINRGLLRNGVFVFPGVDRVGGIGRADIDGVACMPVAFGVVLVTGRGAGVLGIC